MADNNWLSLSEVAAVLGVHPSTVRAWADQGRIPVHRTQGGHRRFQRSQIDLWMKSRQARAPEEAALVVQSALGYTRLQIGEGHLESEVWYGKLDENAREAYRKSGRSLLQGLMKYQTLEEEAARAEARSLGFEYASMGHRYGLSAIEAAQAFLFFRKVLQESMLNVYETAAIHSPFAWGELFRKVNSFTDQILITLLETYTAFEHNGEKP